MNKDKTIIRLKKHKKLITEIRLPLFLEEEDISVSYGKVYDRYENDVGQEVWTVVV